MGDHRISYKKKMYPKSPIQIRKKNGRQNLLNDLTIYKLESLILYILVPFVFLNLVEEPSSSFYFFPFL